MVRPVSPFCQFILRPLINLGGVDFSCEYNGRSGLSYEQHTYVAFSRPIARPSRLSSYYSTWGRDIYVEMSAGACTSYRKRTDSPVVKIKDSPPTWALNSVSRPRISLGRAHGKLLLSPSDGINPYNSPPTHSSPQVVQIDGQRPHPKSFSPPISTKKSHILEMLLHSTTPMTATELAKGVGLRGAASVNADISALKKDTTFSAVTWSCTLAAILTFIGNFQKYHNNTKA